MRGLLLAAQLGFALGRVHPDGRDITHNHLGRGLVAAAHLRVPMVGSLVFDVEVAQWKVNDDDPTSTFSLTTREIGGTLLLRTPTAPVTLAAGGGVRATYETYRSTYFDPAGLGSDPFGPFQETSSRMLLSADAALEIRLSRRLEVFAAVRTEVDVPFFDVATSQRVQAGVRIALPTAPANTGRGFRR